MPQSDIHPGRNLKSQPMTYMQRWWLSKCNILRISSGFVTGCLCNVWGRGLATYTLYIGPYKYILNKYKLVCKVDKVKNIFLYYMNI